MEKQENEKLEDFQNLLKIVYRLNRTIDQAQSPFKHMEHWEARNMLKKYGFKIQEKI